MKAEKAFSLIEVLLVVLILAVLTSIVIPRVSGCSTKAKIAKCDSNRVNLISALDRWAMANDGNFTDGQGNFQNDIVNGTTYFPHGAPVCPYGEEYILENTLKTVLPHPH